MASPKISKQVLTVKSVDAAKPREKRYELADGALPGFYLSVMPTRHKSFIYRYRFGGRTRRLTCGIHPQTTLAQARETAREAIGDIARGIDPATKKAASRKRGAASGEVPTTIDQLVESFLARHARRKLAPSTARAYERYFTKNVLSAWKQRPLDTIKRPDVRALLDGIVSKKGVLSNRVQAALASMYSWAIEQEIVETSPLAGMKKLTKEVARERVLSDAELKLLLNATDRLPRMWTDYTRLLLLTAARRNEVAHMKWSEVDLETCIWTIPSDRAKNGREHRLPLSGAAMAIFRDRERDATGPFVFASGEWFSALKKEIDRLMTAENGGKAIPHWTLHDLRRSGATAMPSLGVSLAVTERIVNHISGSFRGIVSVYQKYKYEPEMRDALERWALHLARLQSNNVIPLRRHG